MEDDFSHPHPQEFLQEFSILGSYGKDRGKAVPGGLRLTDYSKFQMAVDRKNRDYRRPSLFIKTEILTLPFHTNVEKATALFPTDIQISLPNDEKLEENIALLIMQRRPV